MTRAGSGTRRRDLRGFHGIWAVEWAIVAVWMVVIFYFGRAKTRGSERTVGGVGVRIPVGGYFFLFLFFLIMVSGCWVTNSNNNRATVRLLLNNLTYFFHI